MLGKVLSSAMPEIEGYIVEANIAGAPPPFLPWARLKGLSGRAQLSPFFYTEYVLL